MDFKKELEDLIDMAYEVQAERPGPDRDYYRMALKDLEEQKNRILDEIEKMQRRCNAN